MHNDLLVFTIFLIFTGAAVMATLAHQFLCGRVRALVHDFEWAGHTLYELLTVGTGQEEVLVVKKDDEAEK